MDTQSEPRSMSRSPSGWAAIGPLVTAVAGGAGWGLCHAQATRPWLRRLRWRRRYPARRAAGAPLGRLYGAVAGASRSRDVPRSRRKDSSTDGSHVAVVLLAGFLGLYKACSRGSGLRSGDAATSCRSPRCPRSGSPSSSCAAGCSRAFRGISRPTPGSTFRVRCRSPDGSARSASRLSS